MEKSTCSNPRRKTAFQMTTSISAKAEQAVGVSQLIAITGIEK
jgi:hypothetical protein